MKLLEARNKRRFNPDMEELIRETGSIISDDAEFKKQALVAAEKRGGRGRFGLLAECVVADLTVKGHLKEEINEDLLDSVSAILPDVV